nr:methyl-accepting chemotaxis protein [Candidatus Symbiopectobacterium sp. 'North America']
MQSVALIAGGRSPARTPSAPLWLGLLAASSIEGCELLVRQVAAPLAHILQQAMRAAAGQADSMEQLDRIDEIGMLMRAVNQSGLNFRTFVDDVNSNLQALNTACRDIAQGNHTLSQCCEDTEDNLQQTAASVEQLTLPLKAMRMPHCKRLISHRMSIERSTVARRP